MATKSICGKRKQNDSWGGASALPPGFRPASWALLTRYNRDVERLTETPSLGKLFFLALVSTRGAKLPYWKQFLATLRGRP
jgi:hypothetical protein